MPAKVTRKVLLQTLIDEIHKKIDGTPTKSKPEPVNFGRQRIFSILHDDKKMVYAPQSTDQ